MMRKCERCGAQAAGYMDVDFKCNRRRCPLREMLNGIQTMWEIAAEGDTPPESTRNAMIIALDLMRFAQDYNLSFEQWQQMMLMVARGEKPAP